MAYSPRSWRFDEACVCPNWGYTYGFWLVVGLVVVVVAPSIGWGQQNRSVPDAATTPETPSLSVRSDTGRTGFRPVFAGIEVFPSFYLGRWKGGGIRLQAARNPFATTNVHLRLQYYSGVDSAEDRPGTFDLPAPPHWRVVPGVTFWLAEEPFRAFFVRIEGGVVLPQGKVFGELAIGGTLPVWRPVYLTASVSLRTRSVEETPVIAFPRIGLALALYLPVRPTEPALH